MLQDFRLLVFVVVARELSFTRAATELNITQPAVTKHIKELERSLSIALFRRQGNRISLTSDGENLLPYVNNILHSYQKLNDIVARQANSFSGCIKIGASTTIIQYILPPLLAKFRKQYPNIDIVVRSGNSDEIAHEVSNEKLDFALVEGAEVDSSFRYEQFAVDTLVLVTSLKNKKSIEIEELKHLPLIIRENGSGTQAVIERHLAHHNIHRRDLNIEMQIGSTEAIIRYLANSNSYAFLSLAAVKEHIHNGTLNIVNIRNLSITRPLRFLSLHGHSSHLEELVREFITNN